MAKKEVLRVEHVGMKFNLSQEKVDDLKDARRLTESIILHRKSLHLYL